MLTVYLVIAAITFIVLGLSSELTLKFYEETCWPKVFIAALLWPLIPVIILLAVVVGIIKWVAATVRSNLL